jgi:hypothetical protein
MAGYQGLAALAAVTVLAAQPVAAADLGKFDGDQRRGAAFGGLKVSLPLGAGARAKPAARLQLTYSQQLRDSRTGDVRTFSPPGLEFGASDAGKPMLFVGGQQAAEMKRTLGIRGKMGTTIAVVAGVVVVLVLLASVLAAPAELLNPCNGPDDICKG